MTDKGVLQIPEEMGVTVHNLGEVVETIRQAVDANR